MKVIWQSEINEYARKVLKKHWPKVVNHGDVKNINGREIERPDIICGGFPCQDISTAGKGAGLSGSRSGLFYEMARVIEETRPKYVILENVPALTRRGLDVVGDELRVRGYQPLRPLLIEAASVGAPHKRERIFIVAHSQSQRRHNDGATTDNRPSDREIHTPTNASKNKRPSKNDDDPDLPSNRIQRGPISDKPRTEGNDIIGLCEDVADTAGIGRGQMEQHDRRGAEGEKSACEIGEQCIVCGRCPGFWATEPNVGRVANGVPSRVDRIRGLGNAVVPQVAEIVGRIVIDLDKQRSSKEESGGVE